MAEQSPVFRSTDSILNEDMNVRSDGNHFREALNILLLSGFLVLGCVTLTILLIIHPRIKTNPEYGVVFDAGSTHTSAYVYEWPGNERLRGTAVPVYQIYQGTQKPGISWYANDTKAAGASLSALIKNVARNVPEDKKSSTPIYFGATAGMRLVRRVNQSVSDEIMSSVRTVLAKSGFQFNDSNARIIHGEEEGSFGWITVNYLKKVLQEKIKEDTKQSYGALDLGGASTQVTFVPKNSSQAIRNFRLYGKDYPVYAKSYLCYGLTEVYRRYLAQIAKNANYSAVIPDPCARIGTGFNQSAFIIWREPCSCQPSSIPNRTHFTFFGSNNDSECTENVVKLFDFRSTCAQADVFTNDTQPAVRGSFVAFSGYPFITKSLSLSSTPTMGEYKSAYQKYCGQNGNQIKQLHAAIKIVPTCFAGHYVYTLLTYGLGFKNDTWKISFETTVDKKTVGWALGDMINATNIIPLNEPKYARIKDSILIPAIVICGICILIGVVLCVKFSYKRGVCVCKASRKTGYYPI